MEKRGIATNKKTDIESCEYGSDAHLPNVAYQKPS